MTYVGSTKVMAALASGWLAMGGMASFAAAQQAPAAEGGVQWRASIATDPRYYAWETVRDLPNGTRQRERGSQFSLPFGLQGSVLLDNAWKFDLLLRSGLFSSQVDIGGIKGSAGGLTDTTTSFTATYSGWTGAQPFASVAMNLPTGQSRQPGTNSNAKADADLALLPVFGEGLNIGPTLGANILLTQQVIATVSLGHTVRGPFGREGPTILGVQTIQRINPGDVTTLSTSLSYRGEQLSVRASLSWSRETVTTIDGQPFYQAGDRLILLAGIGYAANEQWSARIQASHSRFNPNRVRFIGLPALATEPFNSNSAITKVIVDLTYAGAGWTAGPTASFLYRDRNGYDPTTFEFVSAKTAYTLGVAGSVAPTPTTRIALRVERLWAQENGSPNKVQFGFAIPNSALPPARTTGWTASLSGSARF